MSKRESVVLLGAVFTALMLFASASDASEPQNIAQAAVGTCNQNSVTVQTTGPARTSASGVANPSFKAGGLPCVFVQINHELNALEHAQLQLLIAEHPTQVSTGPVTLGVRLGERTTSIWIDVSNESSYDIHNVWIEQGRDPHESRYRPAKEQTYLTTKLPDAVVTARNLILKGGESARLLAAKPSYISKALAGVPDDWCLYDIGDRAADLDSVGYQEATLADFEKRVANHEFQNGRSETQSHGTVFIVRYMDIFDIPHEVTMEVYLRVAPPNAKSVFYPSRRAYGPLECRNHDPL